VLPEQESQFEVALRREVQPALDQALLSPIPAGIDTFAVASFDPLRSYQSFCDLMTANGRRGSDEVCRVEAIVRDATHVRLRDDLPAHLGPTWWSFQPPPPGAKRGRLQIADPASHVILSAVADSDAFVKVLDTLASRVNDEMLGLEQKEPTNGANEQRAHSRRVALERLSGPDRGYRLTSAGCRALGTDMQMEPVIVVGESRVVLAADIDRARSALEATSKSRRDGRPSGEVTKALEALPAGLTFLAVADHRDSALPQRIASVPMIVEFGSKASLESDPEDASSRCLLDAIGVPRPGALRLDIGRSQMPTADDVRAQLFPVVITGSINDRGYRLISREACPLGLLMDVACVNGAVGAEWTVDGGFRFSERVILRVFGVDVSRWLE
jgi:hypothetical protein